MSALFRDGFELVSFNEAKEHFEKGLDLYISFEFVTIYLPKRVESKMYKFDDDKTFDLNYDLLKMRAVFPNSLKETFFHVLVVKDNLNNQLTFDFS